MNLSSLSFMRPWWLLALLPLGLLLWRVWRAPEHGEAAWRGLIDAHLLAHLLVFPAPRARRAGMALLAGQLMLTVLALAGPALEQRQSTYLRNVTRVLVVDLSPAMAAQLEPVKLKVLALLQAWPDGQTALLVYGGEPYLVVPTTTDVATIALFVPELAADLIPVPGNRPERALRMAGELLKRNAAQQREIVWITAGSNGAELPPSELGGARVSILQVAEVDDPALAGVASRSGGAFVRLRADDGDVRQLVDALATRGNWRAAAETTGAGAADLGYWLLLPLLPLAALVFRRGVLALWLASLLLSGLLAPQPAAAQDLPLAALWADYQGWRLLEAGEPQAAAERFADPRWRAAAHYRAGQFEQAARAPAAAPDADANYNRGNALAKQGKLTEALAAFEQALIPNALDADTRENRDLVLRLLKQQSEAPNSGAGGAAPPPPGKVPVAGGRAPPAPDPAQSQAGAAEREAARVAEQWLRGIPDQPGSLLRRKLQAEHRRRLAGAAREW